MGGNNSKIPTDKEVIDYVGRFVYPNKTEHCDDSDNLETLHMSEEVIPRKKSYQQYKDNDATRTVFVFFKPEISDVDKLHESVIDKEAKERLANPALSATSPINTEIRDKKIVVSQTSSGFAGEQPKKESELKLKLPEKSVTISIEYIENKPPVVGTQFPVKINSSVPKVEVLPKIEEPLPPTYASLSPPVAPQFQNGGCGCSGANVENFSLTSFLSQHGGNGSEVMNILPFSSSSGGASDYYRSMQNALRYT